MTPQAVAQAMRRLGVHAEVENAPPRGRLRRAVAEAAPVPEADAHADAQVDDSSAAAAVAVAVPSGVRVDVPPDRITEVLKTARDELGFGLLSSITATDEGDHIALLYHLLRVDDPEFSGFLLVVVRAVKGDHPDGPLVPSAVPLYPGANLQEREIFDLMGVRFRGHPQLTRVLTWTGFHGHPLRKDYQPVDEEIPWRLAGLRGPDGSLLSDDQAGFAEEERGAWEVIEADAKVAAPPEPEGGGEEKA